MNQGLQIRTEGLEGARLKREKTQGLNSGYEKGNDVSYRPRNIHPINNGLNIAEKDKAHQKFYRPTEQRPK